MAACIVSLLSAARLVIPTVVGQPVTSQDNLLIAEERMLVQNPDLAGVLEHRGHAGHRAGLPPEAYQPGQPGQPG
jgi:hypothetical protein